MLKYDKYDRVIFFLQIVMVINMLLQEFSFSSTISKIIALIINIYMIARYIIGGKKITYLKASIIISVIILVTTNCIISNNKQIVINDMIYYVTFIIIIIATTNEEYISKFSKFIISNLFLLKITLLITNIIIVISRFSERGFYNKWGEIPYFKSFAVTPHVFAAVCLYIILLLFIVLKFTKKSIYLLYIVIPIYGIFECGARVYLAVIAVIILWIIIDIFPRKKYILMLIISIVLILIYFNSNMYQKSIYGSTGVQMTTISDKTSGRSDIWLGLVNDYKNFNILNKVMGVGSDTVYQLNIKNTGMNVWAHNDYLNILISLGAAGVLFTVLSIIYSCIFYIKQIKVRIYKVFFFCSIYFICSMFNAFYITSILVFSIPLFSVIMSNID